MRDGYTLSNLRRAIDNPQLFIDEFTRRYNDLYTQVNHKTQNIFYTHSKWEGGFRIVEQDWDNLIILDACRADLFEDIVDINEFDSYAQKESIDSNTSPWTAKNFLNRNLGDVVYISGNPVTSKVAPNSFHKLIEVWADAEAYDEHAYTVPPEPIITQSKIASENYPEKRLIIHFNQPHYPFLPRPDLIYRKYWPDAEKSGIEFDEKIISEHNQSPHDIWAALKQNVVTESECWEGYRANLKFMISDIIELARLLPGKSVVSSDHGNMIGEKIITGKKIYGHPPRLRTSQLLDVPWGVIEDNTRKDITTDEADSSGSLDSDIIESRLKSLGYLNK